MSLVSAAALSFTSCSSNDDLAGNSQNVDGFYITLNVQTPKASGTRTSQTDRTPENATDDEAKVTTGTFYLYDGNTCVFQKKITRMTGRRLLQRTITKVSQRLSRFQ